MRRAAQLFLDKAGANGLSEDTVSHALSGLLGDGAENIDIGSVLAKVNGSAASLLDAIGGAAVAFWEWPLSALNSL